MPLPYFVVKQSTGKHARVYGSVRKKNRIAPLTYIDIPGNTVEAADIEYRSGAKEVGEISAGNVADTGGERIHEVCELLLRERIEDIRGTGEPIEEYPTEMGSDH